MTTDTSTTISTPPALLIDIDNCPKQLEKITNGFYQFSRIIVCYGVNQPKVSLGLVPLLANAINEGKLELVGMEKKGKNAADFGIAFWAGRLLNELPLETEFIILSNDKDLDHVINLLQSAGRTATRLSESPFPPSSGNETQDTSISFIDDDENNFSNIQDLQVYCHHLVKQAHGKPSKRKTLENSIRAFFKKRKTISASTIINQLIEYELIDIDNNGNVDYSQFHLGLDFIGADDSDDIPF